MTTESKPSRKGKGGRPDKLTPEVEEEIIRRLKEGAYRWVAARMAGVTTKTFLNWLERGAKAEGTKDRKYRLFLEKVEKTEAEVLHNGSLMMRAWARKDWKALAWWLEHRFPKDFGMKLQILLQEEREKDVSKLIQVVKNVCDPDTVARVFEELAREESE